MVLGKLKYFIGSILSVLVLGCANGHCRQPQTVVNPQGPLGKPVSSVSNSQVTERAWIYKYDGTLQCGEGREKGLDSMAEELKSSGITPLKSEKRSDGMMRAQVCGQSTGRANVFEIPRSQLKSAEALGFKLWGFN